MPHCRKPNRSPRPGDTALMHQIKQTPAANKAPNEQPCKGQQHKNPDPGAH